MRQHRLILALTLAIVALAVAAWLVLSINDLYDRLERVSPPLAIAFLGLAIAAAAACGLAAARLFWKLGRADRSPPTPPEDVIKAAEIQADQAETVVKQIKDEAARTRLNQELATLRVDRDTKTFHVVIFGTGSAGKTSLINALLGQEVGETEATLGTTKAGEVHTHTLRGVEGEVLITDTPGLSEIGEGGALREVAARDLAARADLLIFVVDHDLIRTEYDVFKALAKQGKRSIVVLNKKDRFPDVDREAILAKLRERLAGIVPKEEIISVAAAPRPLLVRVREADGSETAVLEVEPPDLGDLRERITALLAREGDSLRAGNLLLRAHLISQEAQDQLTTERDLKARAVIDRFQWITAGAVFVNPVPALDLMAAGAVQFQMISEIAAVYGLEISMGHAKMIGGQMIQTLLKLGMVEAATSLMAGLFKSTLVGFAAGGAVQATTMAYLTHISGHAFAEYFRRGQDWGDGGMQAALVRQFDLHSRSEFLQEFAKQALDRVIRRHKAAKATGSEAPLNRGGPL